MNDTKIEWADDTVNPWWGCQRVSPACEHCYAESLDHRFGGDHWGPRRRSTDLAWVRSLRDQCEAAGVAFFAKQLDLGGGLVHAPVLDGRTHDDFPTAGTTRSEVT